MIIVDTNLAQKLVIKYGWTPSVSENNYAVYQHPKISGKYSLTGALEVLIKDLIKG